MASAMKTTDHDEIRQWIEERKGRPSRVKGSASGDSGGLLRVDFDDPSGEEDDDQLEEIEWDEFFKAFDDNDLAFLHQDETADGKTSRFNKFVSRAGDD